MTEIDAIPRSQRLCRELSTFASAYRKAVQRLREAESRLKAHEGEEAPGADDRQQAHADQREALSRALDEAQQACDKARNELDVAFDEGQHLAEILLEQAGFSKELAQELRGMGSEQLVAGREAGGRILDETAARHLNAYHQLTGAFAAASATGTNHSGPHGPS